MLEAEQELWRFGPALEQFRNISRQTDLWPNHENNLLTSSNKKKKSLVAVITIGVEKKNIVLDPKLLGKLRKETCKSAWPYFAVNRSKETAAYLHVDSLSLTGTSYIRCCHDKTLTGSGNVQKKPELVEKNCSVVLPKHLFFKLIVFILSCDNVSFSFLWRSSPDATFPHSVWSILLKKW